MTTLRNVRGHSGCSTPMEGAFFMDNYIAKLDIIESADGFYSYLSPAALKFTGNPFYIALSEFAESLNIFSEEEWNDFMSRMESLPKERQRRLRLLVTYSALITVDEDGRFELPAQLVDIARFAGKAVLFFPDREQYGVKSLSASLMLSSEKVYLEYYHKISRKPDSE